MKRLPAVEVGGGGRDAEGEFFTMTFFFSIKDWIFIMT